MPILRPITNPLHRRIAYRTWGMISNPEGIPAEWPESCYELTEGEVCPAGWLETTFENFIWLKESKQEEFDLWRYARDLERAKKERMEHVWQHAYDYNFAFFSGGAHAQILELKLAGVTRALEVQAWVLNLWSDYYMRRYAISTCASLEQVAAVSEDFSNNGTPPWTVPEMLAEAQGLLSPV